MDPQYADLLANGVFPRKRMPALPSPATNARQGCCRRERGDSLLGPEGKRPPLPKASGRAPCSRPAQPTREGALLPSPLSWASGLEESLDAAPSEDLELSAAIGALVPEEDLPSLSHHSPLGALGGRGPAPPATPPEEEALVLPPEPLTEPWEDLGGAEPVLGAGWGLEEDPCFAHSFLAEVPPWEG